jgi:di/tricarboxylate transporter
MDVFQVTWMILVLLLMLVLLLSDRVYADHVMVLALALLLAGQTVSVPEALAGFSNEGLLTVLVLFVVASGISRTGGLDWYMGKLLGRPRTLVSAQLRLMLPIAVVSAFLNNTPVVAVMIPIAQRWSKAVERPVSQLLIPLSFASILGGTCTLIGTSTNLVVAGLLLVRYPALPPVSLFSLSIYGVPVLLLGLAYILAFAPLLLPGHAPSEASGPEPEAPSKQQADVLFAARVTSWSPVCEKVRAERSEAMIGGARR